ncbi:hypothetical protein G4G28_14145 [Massilia sp. Dwa41.01b]|uniref:hypothetical protein n=1 Tax=unclassified Massilia TaxID=2609279 RepID=UPI0016005759|nr:MULTISPECIES: hypothetical protein [unclassified Massilia]QNA89326.1 hypothetical protein G4G28_14145 [Massilia sp. Dwa41.01b]QNB00226.1 hypothetical protein G4G31_17725 [Massilia sp. Se16.2.3]
MNRAFTQLWGVPILLGVLTMVGLVSALLGDGIWDIVSACALAVPVCCALWFGLRRKRG